MVFSQGATEISPRGAEGEDEQVEGVRAPTRSDNGVTICYLRTMPCVHPNACDHPPGCMGSEYFGVLRTMFRKSVRIPIPT
jgi:hypothetical protein